MSGEVLRKYSPSPAGKRVHEDPASRRARTSPMVNFRLRGGNHVSFPYGYLLWMNFDPSSGIILHFATHTVHVEGTNLESVYGALIHHDVAEVAETETRPEVIEEHETVVLGIKIEEVRRGRSGPDVE